MDLDYQPAHQDSNGEIRWINRLNTRFQLTLISVLIATFGLSQYLLFNQHQQTIYQEEVERAAFMADGLSRSLQTLMLSGNAEYATDWLERISQSPELLTAQVLRKDQSEAFLDGSTMNKVNTHLGGNMFQRPLRTAHIISDINSNDFVKAVNGQESSKLDKTTGKLTFLLPILAKDECMSCHGYDASNVRGVLRITTSIERAKARIEQAKKDTIIYGSSVAFVIGLLFFIFIRRQIIAPLEQVNKATSRIANGDLDTRIIIDSSNEIGQFGHSFNRMTNMLKQNMVSRKYFETIMNSMGEMVFVTDQTGLIQFANPTTMNTLGYKPSEMIGMSLKKLIKDGREFSEEQKETFNNTGEIKSIERTFLHQSGEEIPVLITVTAMSSGNGHSHQIVHAGRDISRQKRTEKELRLAATVMECDSSAILICDAQANIVLVNPAFCNITGYSKDEVIGQNPKLLSSGRQSSDFYQNMWASLNDKGKWSGEIWNRRKNGEIYPEWLSITAVRNDDGNIINFVSIFTDISEQKVIEQKLSHMAHHDQLTGLPNRTLFTDRLQHALAHSIRDKHKVGLMFIDLDGFKPINDGYGHDVGDALLCTIANELSGLIRDADTVARIGGDEFVIILETITELDDVIKVADKILARFLKPFLGIKTECKVGCSIGISIAPDDSRDLDELVKKADTAMYLAKNSGRQQYCVHSRDCIKQPKSGSPDTLKPNQSSE